MAESNYFTELAAVECPVEKKGHLTYVSWSDAWALVKERYPDATFEWHTDNGILGFRQPDGVWAVVTVVIGDHAHTCWLPCMDHRHKALMPDQVDAMHINKAYQRAMTKAIAHHGLGLYVYQGEDFPNEKEDKPRVPTMAPDAEDAKIEALRQKEVEKEISPSKRVANVIASVGYEKPIDGLALIQHVTGRDPSEKGFRVRKEEATQIELVCSKAVEYAGLDKAVDFLNFCITFGLALNDAEAWEKATTTYQQDTNTEAGENPELFAS